MSERMEPRTGSPNLFHVMQMRDAFPVMVLEFAIAYLASYEANLLVHVKVRPLNTCVFHESKHCYVHIGKVD